MLIWTFDKSVQALILVSSIPPTSAGLMLSSSFVSRGKSTCNRHMHTHPLHQQALICEELLILKWTQVQQKFWKDKWTTYEKALREIKCSGLHYPSSLAHFINSALCSTRADRGFDSKCRHTKASPLLSYLIEAGFPLSCVKCLQIVDQ